MIKIKIKIECPIIISNNMINLYLRDLKDDKRIFDFISVKVLFQNEVLIFYSFFIYINESQLVYLSKYPFINADKTEYKGILYKLKSFKIK